VLLPALDRLGLSSTVGLNRPLMLLLPIAGGESGPFCENERRGGEANEAGFKLVTGARVAFEGDGERAFVGVRAEVDDEVLVPEVASLSRNSTKS
jgi:hypothetical protein